MIKTHCYTKAAFGLLSAVVTYECNDRMGHFSSQVVYPLPFGLHAFAEEERDIFKLMQQSAAAKMPYLAAPYAAVEPDGEVALDIDCSIGTFVRGIKRFYDEKLVYKNSHGYKHALPYDDAGSRWDEAVPIVIRAVQGKLTAEDRETAVAKKFVGQPLDPFKQALLQKRAEALEVLVKDFNEAVFPENDAVHNVASAYTEYLSCLG